MPRHRITFKTFFPVTTSIKRSTNPLKTAALLSLLAVPALCAQTPAPSPAALPPLATILRDHLAALQALKVHEVDRYEEQGTIVGLGTAGTFQTWVDGDRERHDDNLGIRSQRELRIGGTLYVQNASGDVRVLQGLGLRRQTTEDFIDSSDFARHPEDVVLLGLATLRDGRTVWQLRVTPPRGEPYTIGIDPKTYMVDEKSYVDGDSNETILYSDYRAVDGLLLPFTEVDSSGDHAFDVANQITSVSVGAPIPDSVFAPLIPARINAPEPVIVPLRSYSGLFFVNVTIHGVRANFLIDSGAQGIVLDPGLAKTLGLVPQGMLEIRGAERTSANGVVALDSIDIGGAHLPVGVASVVDLSKIVDSGITIDGILGYPFFAAGDVRIDPDRMTMTIAQPGTLAALGTRLDADTDRELIEIDANVNGKDGRFFVDTGNSGDLLLFRAFLDAHPGTVQYGGSREALNHGIGGSTAAVSVIVSQLNIGPFRLFNRYGSVILSHSGAFADRNDAGNIGEGSLDNFIITFELASHSIYFKQAAKFDDGRYRAVQENVMP